MTQRWLNNFNFNITVMAACVMFSHASALAADKVTLQLRWLHQFQFAGYYAAAEKGFYRDTGLDVTIIAGAPGREPMTEVLAGRAQFGTANSGVLFHRIKGQPLVALAAIFQHSPAVFLVRQDSGIRSPQDLVGKKVMSIHNKPNVTLMAMLRNEGIDPAKLTQQKSSYDINDLIEKRTDVFNAYLSNEPYLMKERGIPFTILDPATYGIDFYSDILFTTEMELRNHPDRVKRFRAASLRGWQYAMENMEEIIALIQRKYTSTKNRDHLRFEANSMRSLVQPGGIEIGHMNQGRWRHMAEVFIREGVLRPGYSLEGFIYDPRRAGDTLVFLGDEGLAPYQFIEDEKAVGANVDLLQALGNILGRPVEVRLYPWADTLLRHRRGEGHALTAITVDSENKKYYDFTQATFKLGISLFTLSRHSSGFSEQNWSNRRIAVKRGGVSHSTIENMHPEAQLMPIDKLPDAFLMLQRGDVDGVVEETLIGQHIVKQHNFRKISAVKPPLTQRTLHIPVTRGQTALFRELNQAISRLKSTGGIEKISRRWFGGPIMYITQGEKKAASIAAALTLLLILLLTYFLRHNILKMSIEREQAGKRLRISEHFLAEAEHRAHLGNWSLDISSGRLHWSDEVYRILGYSPGEFRPTYERFHNTIHPDDVETVVASAKVAFSHGRGHTGDHRIVRSDGTIRWVHEEAVPTFESDGKPTTIAGTIQDITEHKLAELKVSHMARHDILTNLPNRALFMDRLKQALARARRNDTMVALLYIDLDNFKPINDTLGHHGGDEVLKGVSARMSSCLREVDTVARIGGDEFAVILSDIAALEAASNMRHKLRTALCEPFYVDGIEARIGASIGIALYPRDTQEIDDLISIADTAMYADKKARKMNR